MDFNDKQLHLHLSVHPKLLGSFRLRDYWHCAAYIMFFLFPIQVWWNISKSFGKITHHPE